MDSAIKALIKYLNIPIENYTFLMVEDKKENGLSIEKNGNSIKITFSKKNFACRALGLLKENIHLERFSISEKSRFCMNGIMFDCSRNGVLTVDTIKNSILQLALMGHNTLLLYTEDTYEIPGEPYFGYMRGRYTVSEIQEIDSYAASFGIELIPCIQTLGHFGQILKWDKVYSDIVDTPDVLLIDEDKSYDLIEKEIRACRKMFSSKRIHVGMDEAHFMGRGNYYDIHGDTDKEQLFCRHLEKVIELCDKYGFRPMIWGDMPLRINGCSEYSDGSVPSQKTRINAKIPDSVDYIYWDYYSTTRERYHELLQAHIKLSNNIIFCGGAWRWSNFTSRITHSLCASNLALDECVSQGIKEVFVTLWGDNGSEASAFASWPVVQLYAERGFYDKVDNEHLSRRFKTCTGGDFEDFCLLEKINCPCDQLDKQGNSAKFLLYQDPLLGVFDYYVKSGFNSYYAALANKLRDCIERNGKLGYIFENAVKLCEVLSIKSELGLQIKSAYDYDDRVKLESIVKTDLPGAIAKLKEFRKTFKKQWNCENKVFGYEVIDIRFGALIQRLESSMERITEYLSGDVKSLPELENERLPYNASEVADARLWSRMVTVANI